MNVLTSIWCRLRNLWADFPQSGHAQSMGHNSGQDVSQGGGFFYLSDLEPSKSFKDALLMPFSEAVSIHRFAEELTEAVETEFPKRMLAPLGIGVGDIGIKLSHKLAEYGSELAKGIKNGSLTPAFNKQGQELLELIKAGKGTFAGKAVAANGTRAASVAASGVTVAVQAAYFVSSMDTLRRLQELDKKADWLVAARRFDQLGKLERIYTHAGELLNMGVHENLLANDIHRLASELTELRAVWRQEFREKIRECDPEKIENDWYLWFGDTRKNKRMEREADGLEPLHAEIHLIRFSFALQWALMASIGRESVFGRITCNGEQEEWRDLAALVERKAELIDARISEQPKRAAALADAVWGVRKLCKDLGTENTTSNLLTR